MLKSIIERSSKLSPMSKTEITIVKSAVKSFLTRGYSGTTIRMLSDDTGIKPGNITYYYRTKEDMISVLVYELMDSHLDFIDEAQNSSGDVLYAYALEIASQVALCEVDDKARDIYRAVYNLPKTLESIKEWTAKKSFHMLRDILPHFSLEDFRRIENVTCGIELSAIVTPCDRYFTLNDKISLTVDSMMKMYDIEKAERERVVEKVLEVDCVKLGKEMFDGFVKRLDNDYEF